MSQDSYRPPPTSDHLDVDAQNDLRKTKSQPANAPPPAPLPPDPMLYQQSRNRGGSNTTSEYSYTQPVRDAVTTAVNSDQATSGADPALVAQITEQVLRSLNMQPMNGQPMGRTLSPQSASRRTMAASPNASTSPQNILGQQSPSFYASTNVGGASDIPDHQLDGRSDQAADTSKYDGRPESPPRKSTQFGSDDGNVRPRVSVRKSTDDATTLEKIWQPLFEPSGRPTERLGQFLRGLAMHIIEDYEPRHSLVIPPVKMLKFYEAVKLPEEMFPWNVIFGGKVTNSSLSHLYRDLKCQHHFVQNYFNEKPQIPALTPLGFENWMTYFIRSYPDIEFERFAKAVLDMPISNADNPRERFPKQLSRRLFPKCSDDNTRFDLEDAMLADEAIQLNRVVSASKTSEMPPPSVPVNIPPGPNLPPPPTVDDDAPELSTSPGEIALEEVNSASVKIERERKPYYAAPGGGRQYNEGRAQRNDQAPPGRSNTTSGTRPNIDISEDSASRSGQHKRTGSLAAHPPPVNLRSTRRQRSPSINGRQQNPYTRSENDVNSSAPPGMPNSYSFGDEEQYQYSRDDKARRYAPEDQRYYQPPPPPLPQQPRQQYDDEYYRRTTMSGGYPPGYLPPQQQGGAYRQGL